MTIMLTPFISCSAKIPIYAVFTAAFFKKYQALVMIALYVGGMVMGILVALLFKHSAFRGKPMPFVMELPNYRLPSLRSVVLLMWDKAKDFLQRAFTVIFLATIIIWFLQSFDTRLNVVSDSADSLLALIGRVIAPVFCSAWIWGLESIHFFDYRIYCQRSSNQYHECTSWNQCDCFGQQPWNSVYAGISSQLPGIYVTLYTMCSSNCSNQTGDGFKASGIWCCGNAVRGCMDCSICCLSDWQPDFLGGRYYGR